MRELDTLLDRYVAATAGMTATIYFLAFFAVTWRLIFSHRRNRVARVSPLTASDGHAILVSVAIAFLVLFIRYSATALGRLERIAWGSFQFDAVALTCDVLMIAAATYAIHAASRSICGCKCAMVFFVSSVFPGGLLYLWG